MIPSFFGWLPNKLEARYPPLPPEHRVNLVVSQGKRGVWRWYAYDDGSLLAAGPVQGHNSFRSAEAAARRVVQTEHLISSVLRQPIGSKQDNQEDE